MGSAVVSRVGTGPVRRTQQRHSVLSWRDRADLRAFAHRDGTYCLQHPDTGDWWTTDAVQCHREHPEDFRPPTDARGFVDPEADW